MFRSEPSTIIAISFVQLTMNLLSRMQKEIRFVILQVLKLRDHTQNGRFEHFEHNHLLSVRTRNTS